jgi:hypothetical protein
MYTIISTIDVTPGMLAEYDAYSERFLDYARRVPGMSSYFQTEDLSHPGRFFVASTLESRRAALAWGRGPDLKAMLQQATPGMFALAGAVEAWEHVATVATGARAASILNATFTTSSTSGALEAFEAHAREWIELYEQHGHGLAFAGLLRLAGSVTRYMLGVGFVSADDIGATFAVPEIAQARRERPLAASALAEPEIVLTEVVRSAVVQPATIG